MTGVRLEPGSFRDPANRVFYAGDLVLRGLGPSAAEDWEALAATDFFPAMVAAGKICHTEPIDPARLAGATDVDAAAGVDAGELAGWATVLRHERIPYVSYPYEWSFSMLRDAALLHLEILLAALGEGITTKDGSAYNLQWRGSAPVFIDVGSFERLRDGEPWAGYRQFCQTMLYPLLLQAHLDVAFQPWLRAQVDGIEPGQVRRLFGGLRRFKAGVFKHVHLHDAVQARFSATTTESARADLRAAGFSRELTVATVRALAKLVRRLDWQPPATGWTGYQATCTYSDADRARKGEFVARALRAARASGGAMASARDLALVLDLGANDGTYSRLAAEHARCVVAVESDAAVVDRLYRRLRDEGQERILPLVMDLANPSPGVGWRGRERAAFDRRPVADAVLALALVHHLAIGRNVPLPEVLDWLAGLGRRLVVEFVDPADPMAQRLLANKPAGLFPDYHREAFERALAERFTVAAREELPSGTRTLYLAVPRG
ncbi:MAG TPA: class I SAM-dependent methyltransferase [Pilimelia sp.]|nr:class I SAM-dependent methyltransferase [Pilimelia sp.]